MGVELENLIKVEDRLNTERRIMQNKAVYPWYLFFVACIFTAILLYFVIIPAIDLAVVKNTDPEALKDKLKDYLSPINYED